MNPRTVPTSPTTSFLPSVILLELQRQQVELQQSLQARLRELDGVTSSEPSPPPPILNVLSPQSNSSLARIEAASRIEAAISAAAERKSPIQKSDSQLQREALSGMMGSSWRSSTSESNIAPHLRSSRQPGVQQVTLNAESTSSLSSSASSSRPSSSKWKAVSQSLKSIASTSNLPQSSEPSLPPSLTKISTSSIPPNIKSLILKATSERLPPDAKRGTLPR